MHADTPLHLTQQKKIYKDACPQGQLVIAVFEFTQLCVNSFWTGTGLTDGGRLDCWPESSPLVKALRGVSLPLDTVVSLPPGAGPIMETTTIMATTSSAETTSVAVPTSEAAANAVESDGSPVVAAAASTAAILVVLGLVFVLVLLRRRHAQRGKALQPSLAVPAHCLAEVRICVSSACLRVLSWVWRALGWCRLASTRPIFCRAHSHSPPPIPPPPSVGGPVCDALRQFCR